jgi:hypothetical protein
MILNDLSTIFFGVSSLSNGYKNLLAYSKSVCVEELGFDDLLLPSAREKAGLRCHWCLPDRCVFSWKLPLIA